MSGRLPVPLVVEVCSTGENGWPVWSGKDAVRLPSAENRNPAIRRDSALAALCQRAL